MQEAPLLGGRRDGARRLPVLQAAAAVCMLAAVCFTAVTFSTQVRAGVEWAASVHTVAAGGGSSLSLVASRQQALGGMLLWWMRSDHLFALQDRHAVLEQRTQSLYQIGDQEFLAMNTGSPEDVVRCFCLSLLRSGQSRVSNCRSVLTQPCHLEDRPWMWRGLWRRSRSAVHSICCCGQVFLHVWGEICSGA